MVNVQDLKFSSKKNPLCLICGDLTEFFFVKKGFKAPYNTFTSDISHVEYFKCCNCGFTFAKSLYELDPFLWKRINNDFHSYIESFDDLITNQPPYLEQAQLINVLHKNNILNLDSALDFGSGFGTLWRILNKYFNQTLSLYDPYMRHAELEKFYVSSPSSGKFNLVICSALFEHLFTRSSFDQINDLVSRTGCLMIHTVICENIPKDPNWFYFEVPVHCSFHTNKSMSILMKDWGYNSSIYCPSAKSWILFKTDSNLEDKVTEINNLLQTNYLIYKKGFVDYWKGF